MKVPRRQFVQRTALLGALAAGNQAMAHNTASAAAQSQASVPSEVIALNRMGFGPRPARSPLVGNPSGFSGDLERVRQSGGLSAYINAQLSPQSIDDSYCDERLNSAQMRINYAANPGIYAAVNELRPLSTLTKSISELWYLRNFNTPMAWNERMWPFWQVRTATIMRAIYSERQLLEIMVDFWHNHFSVNAEADVVHSLSYPDYDRRIRQHALGNFRNFVEAIATSTTMLYSLDNYSNRAGGGEAGNENYARELFELHTLGSDNYLKFYDDRKQVGTITYKGESFARGYIDKDVYEAASCFTGWTVRNGDWRLPDSLPDDGVFHYEPGWHDGGVKIVLGIQIEHPVSSQHYQADGRQVLDLVCRHIGTARHICTKLCRRLVSDNPPADLVSAAVDVWMANRDSSDQIAKTIQVILQSSAFTTNPGQKVRRPFEQLIAYIRGSGLKVPDVDSDAQGSNWYNIAENLSNSGQRLFEWPTPTGHPDLQSFWLGSNSMLARWNMPAILSISGRWWANGQLTVLEQMDTMLGSWSQRTSEQLVDFWSERMLGYTLGSTSRTALAKFLAQKNAVNAPPALLSGETSLEERLRTLIYLISMTPEFQSR